MVNLKGINLSEMTDSKSAQGMEMLIEELSSDLPIHASTDLISKLTSDWLRVQTKFWKGPEIEVRFRECLGNMKGGVLSSKRLAKTKKNFLQKIVPQFR